MSGPINVKSAQRVFMILRRFAEARRPLRPAELARVLGIPISSCIAILATMVDEGVVWYDETNRSYAPTATLRRLTDWIESENPVEAKAVYLARRLHRELGAPTAVTRRAGLYLEWLYTLGVAKLTPGQTRPLCKTVNGLAVLSDMSDHEVEEFVEAHNERFGRQQRVDGRAMLERVRALRGRGYVSGLTPLVPGLAAICFLIADESDGEEVLLTVEVPGNDLDLLERKVVNAVRRLIPAPLTRSMARA
jgi:DNA-binding IclR family transcriptional regulator